MRISLLRALPVFHLRAGSHVAMLASCFLLAACSTAVQTVTGKVAEIALSAVGVRLPPNGDDAAPTRTVALHIAAGPDLNAGADSSGLSAVIRLYKLRDQNNFLSTPYSTFGSPAREKEAIGTDLVEVRELTLTPGEKLELKEKMTNGAAYLGVVSLFRSPYPGRWRFAFATARADQSDIAIGVHACAMTATGLAPVGMTLTESERLSAVKCK